MSQTNLLIGYSVILVNIGSTHSVMVSIIEHIRS